MSRGYDVSTDSLIHLAILEDSFSPALCSVVANFSGQRNHFYKGNPIIYSACTAAIGLFPDAPFYKGNPIIYSDHTASIGHFPW